MTRLSAADESMAGRSARPEVTAFFHEATFSVSYLVADPATGQAALIDTVLDYDPATDRWRARAKMPTARGALAAGVIDGKIHAVGGVGRERRNTGAHEMYDPGADRWDAWIELLGRRAPPGADPIDAMTIVTEGDFGTVCSSLVALPAFGPAIMKFAAGPPDRTPFAPVAL